MVSSLVLTGKYTIGINSKNKIKVDGHLLSLDDIPFIRYRFSEYGEAEIKFIRENKEKFRRPVHLVEITLGPNTKDIIEELESIDKLVKFVYVPVDDNDIKDGLSDTKQKYLQNIEDCNIDRIMLKDKAEMMYPIAAERIKIEIEDACGFLASDIGVCGSCLSFRCGDEPGQACLTAVWARNIMAEYAEDDDIVVPSASHENMDCCGCIRYLIVNSDCPAPLSTKEKSANKTKSSDTNKQQSKSKEAKDAKAKAKMVWDDDI